MFEILTFLIMFDNGRIMISKRLKFVYTLDSVQNVKLEIPKLWREKNFPCPKMKFRNESSLASCEKFHKKF